MFFFSGFLGLKIYPIPFKHPHWSPLLIISPNFRPQTQPETSALCSLICRGWRLLEITRIQWKFIWKDLGLGCGRKWETGKTWKVKGNLGWKYFIFCKTKQLENGPTRIFRIFLDFFCAYRRIKKQFPSHKWRILRLRENNPNSLRMMLKIRLPHGYTYGECRTQK